MGRSFELRRITPPRHSLQGFTLIELLVVIALIALLMAILLPALGKARKSARMVMCENNMHQSAMAMTAYSTDFRGVMCTYSWQPGMAISRYADLNNNYDPSASFAHQSSDIARRMTGRGQDGFYTAFENRYVARNLWQLPVADGGYLGDSLPKPAKSCPEDRVTLLWQANPNDIDRVLATTGDPDPSSPQGFKRLLPFWSSYELTPYAYSPDSGAGIVWQLSGQPGYHHLYGNNGPPKFRARSFDAVLFPCQKVWLYDLFDRHTFKRDLWYAYKVAAQPLAFFDGSVSIRKTQDSNPGWEPGNPRGVFATSYQYYPVGSDSPTLSGQPSDTVQGFYRWTRGGLRGIDFGGKEYKLP